ncbi:hypothetical protein BBJ28_00017703 [Nothophytophthora sp. Chile5]|nr:hypothetical protein BBJ28_00017703 [Nothophytophthora sp. Chile5]
MGNFASTVLSTRPEDACFGFTASDLLLDQMEKQVDLTQERRFERAGWLSAASRCCAIVLTTVSAALTGSLTGSLNESKKTPSLLDAACQTDAPVESLIDRQFNRCFETKLQDDDCQSCTTEATDLLSDAESEGDEQDVDDNEVSDDEYTEADAGNLLDAISAACESEAGDCEVQADRLLQLTATVCARADSTCPIYLEDYLCTCGECPQYKAIALDVEAAKTHWRNEQQKKSITRLLQAFSTYNEVLGYRSNMISAARECLQLWYGDEDQAFKSFVTLYDEVPLLCATPCRH